MDNTQTMVVNHGRRVRPVKSWRRVEMPTGKLDIPAWALDLHINWMEGYGNFPHIEMLLAYDPLDRNGESPARYRRPKPGVYIQSAEGMTNCHYHSGAVSENSEGKLQTTRDDGYSGRTFTIRMADDEPFWGGREIDLRGPWHGPPPEGTVEVYCHIRDEEKDERSRKWRGRPSMKHLGPDRCKWWNLQLTFGWNVEVETFLRIAATKLPHIGWAWVQPDWTREGELRLEPIDPRTNCPKGYLPEQELTS
jgi:hypothetical protein